MAQAQALKAQPAPQELPRITGQGWREMTPGGPMCRAFWVSSQSHPGVEHRVYVLTGRLACDCPGSRFRGMCAHRAIVRQALEAEAAKVRKAEASAERDAERGYLLTAKGRRYLEQLAARE